MERADMTLLTRKNPSSSQECEEPIELSVPSLGGKAPAYLMECLKTNFVSSVGPFVERFEREFAAFVGARYAVACASGTAALHVAMRVLGVGRDDEVFVSTLTFVASANAVRYQDATPVLIDSEDESWNMDPELVVSEIERRERVGLRQPAAIELVHVLGQPAIIEPLIDICERYRIALVEDASEALGASYRTGRFAGRQVGTIGRMGCFSFNGNKIITTGGGGMIVTNDEDLASRARHLTTQAKLAGLEHRHDDIGYNYRLSNLAAALGVSQLELLPEFLNRRREIARAYDSAFRNVQGVRLPPRPSWSEPSCWLYSMQIDPTSARCSRDQALRALIDRNIEARPIWPPVHTQSMYLDVPRLGGRTAERLFERALSLPSSSGLTATQQDRVVDVLLSCLN
jgi:dTDP-4-amino-4,6-dideoxygalactose transaminase